MILAIKSSRILLEAAPLHLDLEKVKKDLLAVRLYAMNLNPLPQSIHIESLCSRSPRFACLASLPIVWFLCYVCCVFLTLLFCRVILASLHVCVPLGATLEQWEQTERDLQHCFSAYGISHVTISPEMYREDQMQTGTSSEVTVGGCRSHFHDEFGCAVNSVRRRTPVV